MTMIYRKAALRTILFAALISICAVRADDLIIGAPVGSPITMTGSAIRLVPNPDTAAPVMCSSIFIQPQPGSTSIVYVLNAAPNFTMARGSAGTTVSAALGPGTATQPGTPYTYPSNGESATQTGGVDMRYFGLVGTGPDTVVATCAIRQ